jgi:hypothetical protein
MITTVLEDPAAPDLPRIRESMFLQNIGNHLQNYCATAQKNTNLILRYSFSKREEGL